MHITIVNLLDNTSKQYSGDDKELHDALAVDYPLQGACNEDIFDLVNDIRRVHYLIVKTAPSSEPTTSKSPVQAAEEVAALTEIDYANHLRVILSYKKKQLPTTLEGSSQEVLHKLMDFFPDYASYSNSGLMALIKLINERHPNVTVYFGKDLDHPLWAGQTNPPDYDDRPSQFSSFEKYNNIAPLPQLLGRTEGFRDDSDDFDAHLDEKFKPEEWK